LEHKIAVLSISYFTWLSKYWRWSIKLLQLH